MHQALKHKEVAQATNLSDEALIPSNDINAGPANQRISELKERIKSARLESLMARQLETELSIDKIEIVEADVLDPSPCSTSDKSDSTTNAHAFASPEINHDKLLSICSGLLENINVSARIFAELGDNSKALVTLINTLNRQIKQANDVQHQPVLTQEKQTRERLGNELDLLDAVFEKKQSQVTELRRKLEQSELERNTLQNANRSLEEKLARNTEILDVARREFSKIEEALKLQIAEREQTEAQSENYLTELQELRSKYETLNSRSLTRQGEHHAKVEELEMLVQKLKCEIEK